MTSAIVLTTYQFGDAQLTIDGIGMSKWYGDADSQNIGDATNDDEDNDDFISFANFSSSIVDISGWRLYVDRVGTSTPAFTFPANTLLCPYDEVTIISDWNGSNPLPDGWYDANLVTGEGMFEETSNNDAYAILLNPTSNQYITIHQQGGSGQSLSFGTKIGNIDFSSMIPTDFEGCEIIYWNAPSGSYQQSTNCTIPKVNSPQPDNDGDGIISDFDINDSDPCVPGQIQQCAKYDTSHPTWAAADCDNDGIPNSQEIIDGTDPYNQAPPGSCPGSPGSCSYTWTSSCTDWITVSSGQTLCIESGSHSCNVNLNGGEIYIAEGAIWSPSSGMNINGGTIVNCGTFNLLNSTLTNNPTIENYGQMYADALNYNSAATIYNSPDAEMTFNFNFNDFAGSYFTNDGVVNFNDAFTVKGVLTNNYRVNVTSNFVSDIGSTVNNFGWLESLGTIRFNTGTIINNQCTFIAEDDIIIDHSITNEGLFYVADVNGEVTVNGATTFTNNGDVVTRRFLNNGTIYGSGDIWVYDFTQQNSSGSTGSDGQGLNFYDASPTGSQYYDIQAGTIHPSVTKNPPASGSFPDRNEVRSTCSDLVQAEYCRPAIMNPHIMYFKRM